MEWEQTMSESSFRAKGDGFRARTGCEEAAVARVVGEVAVPGRHGATGARPSSHSNASRTSGSKSPSTSNTCS
jgi:hypothetical protein